MCGVFALALRMTDRYFPSMKLILHAAFGSGKIVKVVVSDPADATLTPQTLPRRRSCASGWTTCYAVNGPLLFRPSMLPFALAGRQIFFGLTPLKARGVGDTLCAGIKIVAFLAFSEYLPGSAMVAPDRDFRNSDSFESVCLLG